MIGTPLAQGLLMSETPGGASSEDGSALSHSLASPARWVVDEPELVSGSQFQAPNNHKRLSNGSRPVDSANGGSVGVAQAAPRAKIVEAKPSAGAAALKTPAKRKTKVRGNSKGKARGMAKGKAKARKGKAKAPARKEATPHPQMGLSDEELVELAQKWIAVEREERRVKRKAAVAAAAVAAAANRMVGLPLKQRVHGLRRKPRPPLNLADPEEDPAAQALMLLLKVSGLTPPGDRHALLEDLLQSGVPQCIDLEPGDRHALFEDLLQSSVPQCIDLDRRAFDSLPEGAGSAQLGTRPSAMNVGPLFASAVHIQV